MMKQTHFSKSGLKERNWTDKAISLFLKTPNKEVENPFYKSASPMKLYLIKRVKKIEKSIEFQDFQKKNKTRRKGAKKSVNTKTAKLLQEVSQWKIKLQKTENVVKSAIKNYNNFKLNKNANYDRNIEFELATLKSDKNFLDRITVNYLRHSLSNYDKKLKSIFGKIGISKAYKIINKKVYEKIKEVYPELKNECNKQLLNKGIKYANAKTD